MAPQLATVAGVAPRSPIDTQSDKALPYVAVTTASQKGGNPMATQVKTPVQLWIVGGLALLWNAFGGYDYIMTRMRDLDHLASMGGDPNELLAYVDSFPIWAQIGWGLGVWGGVLGSILLLVRSRHAVLAFGVSLIGMALSFGYQYIGPPPPSVMTEGAAAYIPLLVIAVGLALFFYARSMKAKGVLS